MDNDFLVQVLQSFCTAKIANDIRILYKLASTCKAANQTLRSCIERVLNREETLETGPYLTIETYGWETFDSAPISSEFCCGCLWILTKKRLYVCNEKGNRKGLRTIVESNVQNSEWTFMEKENDILYLVSNNTDSSEYSIWTVVEHRVHKDTSSFQLKKRINVNLPFILQKFLPTSHSLLFTNTKNTYSISIDTNVQQILKEFPHESPLLGWNWLPEKQIIVLCRYPDILEWIQFSKEDEPKPILIKEFTVPFFRPSSLSILDLEQSLVLCDLNRKPLSFAQIKYDYQTHDVQVSIKRSTRTSLVRDSTLIRTNGHLLVTATNFSNGETLLEVGFNWNSISSVNIMGSAPLSLATIGGNSIYCLSENSLYKINPSARKSLSIKNSISRITVPLISLDNESNLTHLEF